MTRTVAPHVVLTRRGLWLSRAAAHHEPSATSYVRRRQLMVEADERCERVALVPQSLADRRNGPLIGAQVWVVQLVPSDGHRDRGTVARSVVPFNIACGHCFICDQGLQSQCETTQVRDQGCGAALFGYTKLYGQVPGGQAELLRFPHADYGPIKVPDGPPDDRLLYLSDVLPTAWQAVQYAAVPKGGSLVVLGLGPIGQMACRVAIQTGVENVIGIDLVPERLARTAGCGVDVLNWESFDDPAALIEAVRSRTNGRGPDAVIDAVGMEAKGVAGRQADPVTYGTGECPALGRRHHAPPRRRQPAGCRHICNSPYAVD